MSNADTAFRSAATFNLDEWDMIELAKIAWGQYLLYFWLAVMIAIMLIGGSMA